MSTPWHIIRAQFPATTQYTYLNSATASPIPMPVVNALVHATHDLALRGEKTWSDWIARVEEVRKKVARFINAEPDEIAFTQNTSTGINLLADLLGRDGALLSNNLEFPAGTLPWLHRGVRAHFVQDRGGILYPEDFATEAALQTKNIVLSQVQFSNGCRQHLPSFSAIKGHRNLIICGSQSIGAFSFDAKRDGVDALATSGHKWLCAGFGAGFVYLRRELVQQKIPTSIGWLSVEDPFAFENQSVPPLLRENRRSELGCQSYLPIFALGAAIDFISSIGIEAIETRVLSLQTKLTDRLQEEGFRVLSPFGAHRSGECIVASDEPAKLTAFLREHNVLVTEKPQGIRVATHFYNNEEDIERFIYFLRGYREPQLLGRPEVF